MQEPNSDIADSSARASEASKARDADMPAFPRSYAADGHNGMTLRDYFAAKAMHQIIAGAVLPAGFDASEQLEIVGNRAYEIADAMLKARSL